MLMSRYDAGRVTEMRRIAHVFFLVAVVDREQSYPGKNRNGGRLELRCSQMLYQLHNYAFSLMRERAPVRFALILLSMCGMCVCVCVCVCVIWACYLGTIITLITVRISNNQMKVRKCTV